MKYDRPPEITLRHIAKDMAVSLLLVLGTAAVEWTKRHSADLPIPTQATLLALELALLCFALGYTVRAGRFLWDQIADLVEHIAKSPTLPKLRNLIVFVLKACLVGVRVALILCLVAATLALVWALAMVVAPNLAPNPSVYLCPFCPPLPVGRWYSILYPLTVLSVLWVIRIGSIAIQLQSRANDA